MTFKSWTPCIQVLSLFSSIMLAQLAYGEKEHNFSLSIPLLVALDGQFGGRAEFNLAGKATLTAEVMSLREGERYSDKRIRETGDSLITDGREASLIATRYSQPMRMAGFFWRLGLGYRQGMAQYKVKPNEGAKVDYSGVTDDQGKVTFTADSRGPTGHGGFGYRYVGEDFPAFIQLHLGFRHFQATLKDKDSDSANAAPLNDLDQKSLGNQLATAINGGISVGYAF